MSWIGIIDTSAANTKADNQPLKGNTTMSIFSKLYSHISISSNRKVTPTEVDNGKISSLSYIADKNEDGSFLLTLKLAVDSDNIKFVFDGERITKVAFIFDVQLHDCIKDNQGKWLWDSECGYSIVSGKQSPNIIACADTKALNSTKQGCQYVGGLTQDDDASLGYQIPLMMIAKTPRNIREKTFEKLVREL